MFLTGAFGMEMNPIGERPAPPAGAHHPRATELRSVAQAFEAAFLAEMLKSAGVGETPDAFGGGAGEDQFASFLREEHARLMTEAGGIGLAEQLFEAMVARADG